MQSHTHIHTHTHTCKHMHAHAHTHTYTYKHTPHTHTHTCMCTNQNAQFSIYCMFKVQNVRFYTYLIFVSMGTCLLLCVCVYVLRVCVCVCVHEVFKGFMLYAFSPCQIKMGVTTGWGGATRLVNLLGRPRSLHILGSGRVFTAAQALTLGLAEHTIPDSPDPLAAAETLLLDHYCCGATSLVRSVKENVVEIESSPSVMKALTAERRTFASVWGGEIQKAALEKNIKHS